MTSMFYNSKFIDPEYNCADFQIFQKLTKRKLYALHIIDIYLFIIPFHRSNSTKISYHNNRFSKFIKCHNILHNSEVMFVLPKETDIIT